MSKQTIEIRGGDDAVVIEAALTAHIVKEKPGMYASYCPALDLCSQGATVKEARENIREATELFIESCFGRGVLHEVLAECGFSVAGQKRKKPARRRSVKLPAESRVVSFPAKIPLAVRA